MTPAFKWVLCVLAAGILWIVFARNVRADVLRGDQGSCSHFSTIIQNFGDYRDNGVTWDIVEPTWARMVADALAAETSYVRTAVDAQWVTQKAKGLWETKDPAILYAANVYAECMKTAPKLKRKVML